MTSDLPLPGLSDAAAKPDHKGHRERLRKRFIDAPEAMPDYELLELLLGIAIPQRDTKPLAKALIKRFGSFADVITAEIEDLTATDGVKEVSATALKVVREAAIRLARAPVINTSVISNWEVLLDYCRTAMATLTTEQFRLLFLDRKNTLIADELQQTGTVDHTPLYPREVVKRALALHASAVILVHNHPSGDPAPSRADIDMTRAVKDALGAVGIAVHDH
ncbi:MAG: DNA repair protein RadC, partial [Magnetospirillum sp.]|nr:DNA repair protein RadC [Magnetospirillum sp.]